MNNKGKTITNKISEEFHKNVWLIKDKEGNIIDSFRQKIVAQRSKIKLEKTHMKKLFLERDNSIREKLKENLYKR